MKIKLDKGAKTPTRAHATDAGLDIYALHNGCIPAHGGEIFRTGVHVELPYERAGLLVSKSGLNTKHDIITTGLIDEGYTGEIVVKAYNLGDTDYRIIAGDKITQLVVLHVDYEDVEIVDSIDGGERGDDSFGSTGR